LIPNGVLLEISLAMYLRRMGCTQKAFQVSKSQVEEKKQMKNLVCEEELLTILLLSTGF